MYTSLHVCSRLNNYRHSLPHLPLSNDPSLRLIRLWQKYMPREICKRSNKFLPWISQWYTTVMLTKRYAPIVICVASWTSDITISLFHSDVRIQWCHMNATWQVEHGSLTVTTPVTFTSEMSVKTQTMDRCLALHIWSEEQTTVRETVTFSLPWFSWKWRLLWYECRESRLSCCGPLPREGERGIVGWRCALLGRVGGAGHRVVVCRSCFHSERHNQCCWLRNIFLYSKNTNSCSP